MSKICILTEGGGTMGMGHISRCLSLYQGFETLGYHPQLIIRGNRSAVADLNYYNILFFDWLTNFDELRQVVNGSLIAITDSYYCKREVYNLINSYVSLSVYIDDNMRVDYPSGVIINGIMGSEKIPYPIQEERYYMLGCEYAFLRKDYWDVDEKNINENIETIMITCGAADDKGVSRKVLEVMDKYYPFLKKKVIIGNDISPKWLSYRGNAEVIKSLSASEMKKVMLESDVAITASGQTTYELCRTGTPFIALITAENQTFSINNFYKRGLIDIPLYSVDKSFDQKLLSHLDQLKDYSKRKKISYEMKNCIDGLGPIKIANNILKYLNQN
jgi:spore coat polysaccharide biosynthesis predicted glycosyltransferase SpsG